MPAPPLSPHLAQAFRLWTAHVAALLAAARAALDGRTLCRTARNAARARLRIAEAVIRRMVLLLAVTLDIEALPPLVRTPVPARAWPDTTPGLRRLALADPRRLQADYSQFDPAPDPDATFPVAPLGARIAVLDAVMEDPWPMARRMAAWMRQRARRALREITWRTRPEALILCRLGAPPGLTRSAERVLVAAVEALRSVHSHARTAYPP